MGALALEVESGKLESQSTSPVKRPDEQVVVIGESLLQQCENDCERETSRAPLEDLPRSWRCRTLFGKGIGFWALITASSMALVLGLSSGTLLGRLYFAHGGTKRWLYTWIESAGWPVIAAVLLVCYKWQGVRPTPLTPKLAMIYTALGCMTACDNLLYSWGLSYLPVSTNSIVSSTQLAFNALFAVALVRQRVTAYVVNCVVCITAGTVLMGVSAGPTDRPQGVTEAQYVVGFVTTIAASALFALLLPLIELLYMKSVVGGRQARRSFVVVMEVQVAISIVASVVSLIGMWAAGDLKAIHREAVHAFDLGPTKYAMTLLCSAVGWQLYFVGGVGVIFAASSLMSCVLMTAMIPALPLLALVFFGDHFDALKGIALAVSFWGFCSYIYGGYLDHLRSASSKPVSAAPTAVNDLSSDHSLLTPHRSAPQCITQRPAPDPPSSLPAFCSI